MSIPITNSDEYARDSFISFKKQLYSNEKILLTSLRYHSLPWQ